MADEGATAEESDEDLSALLSSASLMLFIGSLGSVSRLLERVVMGRYLGPDAFGEVQIGFSIMTVSATVAMLGLREGIPRFMTRFENAADTRGAWVTGTGLSIVLTVIVVAGLALNVERLSDRFFDPSTPPELLVVFIATLPFFVGLEIVVAGIRGRENTIYRTYSRDLIYNILRLGLIVVLLAAGYGVVAAGAAYLASAAVGFAVALWLFNRLFSLRGAFRTRTREMVVFSMPLMLSSMVSILLAQIDTLMIANYLPTTQAGIYNAAWPLARAVGVIVSSFGFLFLPLMSRLDAGGRDEEINRMYKLTSKWVFVVTFPALLCLVAFADDLLLVFGPEYTPGAAALAILALGSFTSAAFGRCQDALSAFGYTKYIFAVNAVAGVLNVALNAVLITGYGLAPDLGINGAAAATAISTVTLNGSALAVLWYKSGVNPLSRWTIQTFVLLPAVLFPPSLLLAQAVTLPLPALIAFVPIAGIAAVALLALTGSLQAEDEIPVDLIEANLGITIPLIRRYIPEADGKAGEGTEES
jgi:O-antigen/teichoic acid export membrane protein